MALVVWRVFCPLGASLFYLGTHSRPIMMGDSLADKALDCTPEDTPRASDAQNLHKKLRNHVITVEHACGPANGEMRGRETDPWKLTG